MMNKDKVTLVVNTLSDLLMEQMQALSLAERHPGGDPDASDDYIAEKCKVIESLRIMRTRFEETMSGVTVDCACGDASSLPIGEVLCPGK